MYLMFPWPAHARDRFYKENVDEVTLMFPWPALARDRFYKENVDEVTITSSIYQFSTR